MSSPNIQGEYAMKAGTSQPIVMKAIEILLVDENETIDFTMCAIHKGARRKESKG
jgi:hypothetical protein